LANIPHHHHHHHHLLLLRPFLLLLLLHFLILSFFWHYSPWWTLVSSKIVLHTTFFIKINCTKYSATQAVFKLHKGSFPETFMWPGIHIIQNRSQAMYLSHLISFIYIFYNVSVHNTFHTVALRNIWIYAADQPMHTSKICLSYIIYYPHTYFSHCYGHHQGTFTRIPIKYNKLSHCISKPT